MKNINTLIALFSTCFCIEAQTTIFVNKNVQGGLQNGTNWINAFLDLQSALALANAGDEIWVAAATYYPTSSTDRSISFVLKQGVKMYGGFEGTETGINQRDFGSNETTLSGNIGAPNSTDNSYHILYGTGVDSATIVDGFVISRGGASNASFPNTRGGGLYLEPSPNLYNTCPVIQNCRFEYNSATSGAAIFCSYEYDNIVNPILRNCKFAFNRATTFAGALYKSGPALPDRPFVVEKCLFLKNAALTYEGGGAYLTNTGNTTIFRNCIFEKDSATLSSGAGIYYAGFEANASSSILILDSCIFKENYATEGAGLVYTDFVDGDFYCFLNSCFFERNKAQNSDGAALFMVSYGSQDNKIEIDIQNTVFSDNTTYTYYNTYISAGFKSNLSARFKNCKFLNNKNLNNPNITNLSIGAGVGGGGSKGKVTIENCLFANNGGGVAVLSAEEADMQTNITNCTFYKNNRFIVDKTWFLSFDTSHTYRNDCYITNSIFWEPDSDIDQMFTNNDFTNVNMYDYYIDHSIISLNSTNIPGGAAAFGDHVVFDTYPMFMDTVNDDFRLIPCSPAVNKGDNVAVDTISLTTDLDGNLRIYQDTVDLGAYEVQDTCQTIGSAEPNTLIRLYLSPNPMDAGGELLVQFLSEKHSGRFNWSLADASGRQLSAGIHDSGVLESFSISAPKIPGVYFLILRDGMKQVQLKLVVH